jgi:two-component system, NtrC family, sensor histidine kinase HydH
MSIRLTVRMAAPSIIISLLLLTVGSVGGWYIQRMQRSTAQTVSLDMATIQAAEEAVFSIMAARMELAQFLATGDSAHLKAIPAICNQIEISLVQTEKLADDEDEISLTHQIRAGYEDFLAAWKTVSLADPAERTRLTVTRLKDQLTADKLLAPAKELLSLEERLIHKTSSRNQDVADRVAVFLWLLGICGAAAGLFAGFGIAVGISQSIVNLYVPIRAASGRLEEVIGPVNIAPARGIAHLDEILRGMADHVGTVVDRLQQTEHEVLRAEQMSALGQLAAGMAHELRNPLTSLKLLVQAAVESGPDAGLRGRDLAVVADETARLDRLLQTFLDFARPPKLEKRRADVLEVLRPTLELVSARARSQEVEIRADFPPRLSIEADHEQLRQVFLNLVLNALDAQPRGGAIRVAADCQDGFTLTVADDGPGIPADLAPQIFEPYISTKDSGLGLGLAISRRIVEAHGGRISVAAGPAGGAIFTVRIPDAGPVNFHEKTGDTPCKAS